LPRAPGDPVEDRPSYECVWQLAPGAQITTGADRAVAQWSEAGLLLLAGINYGLLSRLPLAKEIAVLVVCGLGAGVYGVCLLAFRAVTVAELKATLRREPGGSAVSGLD
jgi:hypothetical protein